MASIDQNNQFELEIMSISNNFSYTKTQSFIKSLDLYNHYKMGNKSYNGIKEQTLNQRNGLLQKEKKLIHERIQILKLNIEKIQSLSSLTVVSAVDKLNKFQLSSQELLTALAFKTITIGEKLNLFTYLHYEKSLIVAQKCDQQRKISNKKNITLLIMRSLKNRNQQQKFLPALFGIPISIKDVQNLQHRLATSGLVCNAKKKQEQSILIKCFRNAGMIPFVQTNVPQFCMAFQTNNNLWGRSKNPWNQDRAVGGSSGGEGGMIASRCSIIGVGSDIGGSIRTPSDHCGVFGLKPYSKRISNSYHAKLSHAFESFSLNIPNNIGPLARSSEDLALFMAIVTNENYYKNEYYPYQKIIKFDTNQYFKFKLQGKKCKIGYIQQLQDIQPSPASRRALKQVIEVLQKNGHQLVKVKIPNQRQVMREFVLQYMSTGAKNYRQILAGQEAIKQYRTIFLMGRLKAPGRFLLTNISKWFMPRTYFYFLQKKPYSSVLQYQSHSGIIENLKKQWIKYWRQLQLDFVISPGFGCQAVPHGKSERIGLASAYTFVWNVLDMAVGAMPVTRVQQDQQVYKSRTNDILTMDLKYICANSKGLPAGIQIISLPYHQQKLLGFMSWLQQQINFYENNGYAHSQ